MGRVLRETDDEKLPRVFLMSDYPTDTDEQNGEIFSGASVMTFEDLLVKNGVDLADVYATSLHKCYFDGYLAGKTPKMLKEHQACRSILDVEIRMIDPDVIIPMGVFATRLCGISGGMAKSVCNAQEVDCWGRRRIVLPLWHPHDVPSHPGRRKDIERGVATLASVLKGGIRHLQGANYRTITDMDEAVSELRRLQNADILAFDIETNCLNPWQDGAKVVSINLSDHVKEGICIPLYHDETPFSDSELTEIVAELKALLENPDILKAAHNGKFDKKFLRVVLGIKVASYWFDTMLGNYLTVSEELGEQGLKKIVWKFTDMGGYDNPLDEYKETLPAAERGDYGKIPLSILGAYGGADADAVLRLVDAFSQRLRNDPQWDTLFFKILMPGSDALEDVEVNGLKMDMETASRYSKEYRAEESRVREALEALPEVRELESEWYTLYQERQDLKVIKASERTPEQKARFKALEKYKEPMKFNFASTSHLRRLLFDKLELSSDVKTDSGDLSTASGVLEELAQQHEVPAKILEHRGLSKLLNAFIDKIPGMVDKDGILHPVFQQTGCLTADTLVLTAGGLLRISDIVGDAPDSELTLKGHAVVNGYGKLEYSDAVVRYSDRETIRLTTRSGMTIEGTPNHPMYCSYDFNPDISQNWKRLDQYEIGDFIAVLFGQGVFGNKPYRFEPYGFELTPEVAQAVGMLLAKGRSTKHHIKKGGSRTFQFAYTARSDKELDIFKKFLKECFQDEIRLYESVSGNGNVNVRFHNNKLFPFFEAINCVKKRNRRVPDFILQASEEVQKAFLRGFTVNGSVRNVRDYGFSNTSRQLLSDIKAMLLNMGIIGVVKSIGKDDNTNILYLYGNEGYRFAEKIGFMDDSIKDEFVLKPYDFRRYEVDRDRNVMLDEVVKIDTSRADVYDIRVPGTHSFIANGAISHNTVTGRLSSNSPNIQQLPRHTENVLSFQYTHEPKGLFVSRFGKDGAIANYDFASLEIRVAAIISGDKHYREMLQAGTDFHKATAALVFGVPIEQVTKEMRQSAKAVNFG